MFTLFGFAAAVTERVKLFSTILLLAQRQTGLVAKQAAEVDVLSNGRLILGVGVGHTDIEFKGLGVDFHTRGQRIEEQIDVLRMLWTQDVVHFKGKFHDLDGVGIYPLPVQRPIPIWIGGWKDTVLRRAVTIVSCRAPAGAAGTALARSPRSAMSGGGAARFNSTEFSSGVATCPSG